MKITASVVANGLLFLGYSAFGLFMAAATADPIWGFTIFAMVSALHINALKGKDLMAWIFVIYPVSWIGVVRLARPDSWWFKHMYEANGSKQPASIGRFGRRQIGDVLR